MDALRKITPVSTPLRGSIRPPGSKSQTNRAVVCAALGDGRSVLTDALDSDDTRVMVKALQALGIAIDADWPRAKLVVDGCAGVLPTRNATLDLDGSGTSIRFLTALVATGTGLITLDGNTRMRERPIGELADALRQCGTEIETQSGFPPVVVRANRLCGKKVSNEV